MSLCASECPICHGGDYVRRDRPVYDPLFGQVEFCPNINPFKIYGKMSGLDLSEYNLSWRQLANLNGLEKEKEKIDQVIGKGFGWIYIWGDVGLGKSTILKTIVAECIRKRIDSTYRHMVEILDDLRSSYNSADSNIEFDRRITYWKKVSVLCIDEFDRFKGSDYTDEKVANIMDHRYCDAINKKSITVMASNNDPTSLDRYLADRIYDNRFEVIHLQGISIRPNFPR